MSTTRKRTAADPVATGLLAGLMGLVWIATATTAAAQSVAVENDHLVIRDAAGTTQVDIGGQVIVEGLEIRVVGPGLDLQALINAITDAEATKPYLIRLGHGSYPLTVPLTMKEYVSVSGSGPAATLLTGAVSTGSIASSAIVVGADNMAITDLTVENTGGSAHSVAIYNSSSSPKLQRVTAKASGGTNNHGVFNVFSSSPRMIQVTAEASGGTSSAGVENISASLPTMTQVTALATGGSGTNRGVYNDESSPVMRQVTATASGGLNNTAVYNNTSSSPTMTQCLVKASGGTNNIGVYNEIAASPIMSQVVASGFGGTGTGYGVYNNDGSASPLIRHSSLEGNTAGIWITSADARVAKTRIVGGDASDPAGTQCRDTYDENLQDVNC